MSDYPWYGLADDDTLQQGDLLFDCPFDELETEEEGFETAYDVVVLSHSCDLAHNKMPMIQVCPFWDLETLAKDIEFFRGKRGREELRRGGLPGYHSDSDRVSGRAREISEKGFYFLKYDPNGSKPGDVWDILPEDTQKRKLHFAPYPEDLCRIPILATCPANGIVLDPFAGTGTTNLVAFHLGRKSVGIDVSTEYLLASRERCRLLL